MSVMEQTDVEPRFERSRKINSTKLLEWIKSTLSTQPQKLDKHWDQWIKLAEITDIEMSIALDDLEAFGFIKLKYDDASDTLISLSSRRGA